MKLSDFDYELPTQLIAQEPPPHREDSRLMFLDRATGAIRHLKFPQIVELLRAGDVLVVNDTRVLPARLFGRRATGGKVDALLVQAGENGDWQALLHARSRFREDEILVFKEDELAATVVSRHPEEGWWIHFIQAPGEVHSAIFRYGLMPLPPYIKREGEDDPRRALDRERYQTVYAGEPGAIAAPTAGLHFSEALLAELKRRGIEILSVTLHVGLGTFKPVTAEDPRQHLMHAEFYRVGPAVAEAINVAKGEGRRVLAVGTTACRTLESCAKEGRVRAESGWTRLFIYPPYEFQVVDGLITNFHVPRSTLLMLVSALAGRERILEAYRVAVAEGYRFFSYGDAMVIL